jgi:hypothetical protein
MNTCHCLSPARSRPSLSLGRGVALLISLAAIGWLCAPSAAVAAPTSVNVSATPTGANASLHVANVNGKAAELLRRLTFPQLAAVLNTTPAKLKAQLEGGELLSGQLGLELGELLSNPKATVQEVLDLLAAHGVSAARVEQIINPLLAHVTETGEQLRLTINEVLADLSEDGQIEALAKELGLTPAALEAVHLLPSTIEKSASTLGTTSSNLISTLLGAGATTQPGSPESPVGAAVIPGAGTSLLLVTPNGSGGLSLTLVNSGASGPSASSAASATISNAFTILSITVTPAGLVREKVSLPGPGQLAVNASTKRKVAVRSSRGRKRTVTRNATLASVGQTLAGGVSTVTFRLRGPASRVRPLVVKLITTYTPTGGSARALPRSVTVGRASKKRHG